MEETFDPRERLACLLDHAAGNPYQSRFERLGYKPVPFKHRALTSFDRIQYCSQALLSGALPDLETLIFVALAFDRYISEEGRLSLDEAFRLRSKSRAGNPARQFADQNKKAGYLLEMARMRAKNPSLPKRRAAEEALQGDESLDPDTLVKAYRLMGFEKAKAVKRRRNG
jgi:hypothetical protein